MAFCHWNWLIDYFQKFACLTCHTLYGWINNYWNFIVRDLDVDKKIVSCNICSSSLEKYVDVDLDKICSLSKPTHINLILNFPKDIAHLNFNAQVQKQNVAKELLDFKDGIYIYIYTHTHNTNVKTRHSRETFRKNYFDWYLKHSNRLIVILSTHF